MNTPERRKYGDLSGSETPPPFSHPVPETSVKTVPEYQKTPKKYRPWWKKLIEAVWSLLKFVLTFPFFLWKRSPSLAPETKQRMRKKIFKYSLYTFALGLLFIIVYGAWVSKDLPDPNRLIQRHLAQSTKIYDRTGEVLLYEIFADEKRTIVSLDQIPKNLINGVIATEDKSFYEHHGIRPLSMLRSFVYGVFGKSRIGSGASTLTQQLVKNAILGNSNPYTRKPKEVILSVIMEQKYTKDEILQIYFNEIPYGSTNYGVETAAQSYFGKPVSQLDLEQCATLAGLPKAPSKYLNNLDALKERRNFVLRRMKEENYISEEQMKEAQEKPLSLQLKYSNVKAPHFVFYVKEQLVEQFGEQTVDTGGLKVITTLDAKKQEIAENAVKENEKVLEEAGGENTALLALDPKSSQILAYIGSRDFFNKDINGQFDVVNFSRREPGSSIKPIIYAAAFEKGYTPDTTLFDVVTNFSLSGQSYTPKNYDGKERGPVNMRYALQNSLNIPAVQTFYLVGEKKGIEFAKRLGYTTFNTGNFGLSLVLGGGGVSMLEHVNAYAVFANNGTKNDVVSILKVTDPNGEVLYEWKDKKGEQVVAPEVTATITNVLSDDVARRPVFGANSVLALKDRPVAAKTGTTNDYRDAWIVGYTPSLVAGVWAGNNDYNKPMRAGFGGSRVAGQIWNKFMRDALANTPVENFPTPPPNDAEKPALRGSAGGGVTLMVNKVTGKLATSSTPADLIEERTFIQPHSILHYVNKDDPRGPYPEDPSKDPQYQNWENAIQNWITRRREADPNFNISFEEPPTEYDDEYSLELIPTLTVYSPQPNQVFPTRHITTNIEVKASRGVSRVRYKIDTRNVATITSYPFNLDYEASDIEDGAHTLTITVEDDVGNKVEQQIPFTIGAGEIPPTVNWVDQKKTLRADDFPAAFYLQPIKLNDIREIKVYRQRIGDSNNKTLVDTIKDFTELTEGRLPFRWLHYPGDGEWMLTTEVYLKNGGSSSGESLQVEVL